MYVLVYTENPKGEKDYYPEVYKPHLGLANQWVHSLSDMPPRIFPSREEAEAALKKLSCVLAVPPHKLTIEPSPFPARVEFHINDVEVIGLVCGHCGTTPTEADAQKAIHEAQEVTGPVCPLCKGGYRDWKICLRHTSSFPNGSWWRWKVLDVECDCAERTTMYKTPQRTVSELSRPFAAGPPAIRPGTVFGFTPDEGVPKSVPEVKCPVCSKVCQLLHPGVIAPHFGPLVGKVCPGTESNFRAVWRELCPQSREGAPGEVTPGMEQVTRGVEDEKVGKCHVCRKVVPVVSGTFVTHMYGALLCDGSNARPCRTL